LFAVTSHVKSGNIYFVKLKFGILRLLPSLDGLVIRGGAMRKKKTTAGGGGEKKMEETKKAAWGMYIDRYDDEYDTEEDDLARGRPILSARVRPLL
jgi:hypothetical protein